MKRRSFLKLGTAAAAAASFPHIWLPNRAAAQTSTSGRDTIKHLVYIRLSGGFRFPVGFNADVNSEFNPFGMASGVPSGVDWGVGDLLSQTGYLDDARTAAGMRSIPALAPDITVMPTVDHEPLSGRADGNHTTGLERYLTGYVNGESGFFTRINYGLRQRYADAAAMGEVLLPPFVMGTAGMARGVGALAPYRPPVLIGASFERFVSADSDTFPDWATQLGAHVDVNARDRRHPALRARVDAYLRSREATAVYSEIFASELLDVEGGSDELVDGVSNQQLSDWFGTSRDGRNVRLALRLFHYGCPAVYLDQGGYDYHSDENDRLPGRMEELNHLLSATELALRTMSHPSGGTYWDHTLVVLGSEFSRTARGSRFNSAGGSDHSGDNATRWMSMPFMGGPIPGGRVVGATTRRDDLAAQGTVYSYRSVMNTLMDGLGCSLDSMFPTDNPIEALFT